MQVAVASISIGEIALMPIGTVVEPETTILPTSATDKRLTWSTSDPEIATVDADGRITAVGAGTTDILAVAHNGLTATVTVQVFRPIEMITLSGPETLFTLEGYESGQIQVEFEPADATDRRLYFSSDNPDAVTVDENGNLTAVGTGTATITVRGDTLYGEGIQKSITVTAWQVENVLKLPTMVMEIEEEAFSGNETVNAVILGDRVSSIGSRAFADMTGLKMIAIPDSVQEIAGDAFENSQVILVCSEGSYAWNWAEEHEWTKNVR